MLASQILGDNDEIFCSDYFYIRLGIRREDLPKYEEQLEQKIAKAQLEGLKKDAIEAMETQKKRFVAFTMHLTFFEPVIFFQLVILGKQYDNLEGCH